MDFIWSANPDDLNCLVKAMQMVGIKAEEITLAECGKWGALVATRSPYSGLQPLFDEDVALVIIGDPLLKLNKGNLPAIPKETHRSRLIKQLWAEDREKRITLTPHHPATLFHIDRHSGEAELIIDAYGAITAFRSYHRGQPLIATTPDLIAAVLAPSLDRLSALELLAAQRISYPYTLYEGIEQLIPGSIHDLLSGKIVRWWKPPIPEKGVPPEIWAGQIREVSISTLDKITRYVSNKGVTTLSAGQDTRVIATLAAKLMELEAVTVTAMSNPESWVARRVARELGVPHRHIIRQPNHYGDLYKSRPLILSSQNLWTHAHFHLNSLQLLPDTAFVLGGYTADTLFRRGGIQYKIRRRLIDKYGLNPSELSIWAAGDIALTLEREVTEEISARWENGLKLLGLTEHHSDDLIMAYPLSQQISSAHFHAARRNGPQYEIFMTMDSLDLAFRIPASMKSGKNSLKKHLFLHEKERFSETAIFQKKLRAMIEMRNNALPEARTPKWWPYKGAWRSMHSPFDDKELKKIIRDSQNTVFRMIGIKLQKGAIGKIRTFGIPCLQIESAIQLCR